MLTRPPHPRWTALTILLALGSMAACSTPAGSSPQLARGTIPAATFSAPAAARAASSPTTTAQPVAAGNPSGLTDAQMVGQLFMAYVYGASATSATPAQRQANIELYGEPTGADVVRRWHLGGLILLDHNTLDPNRPDLSTGNVGSAAQMRALTAGLQQAALADSGVRLLIATDQEGGRVQRITSGVTARPAQLAIAGQSPAALRCGYFTLGQQLLALGVNQDFAPDADVVRTRTGVIGDRSFGPDPAVDGRDVAAAVSGLQAAGVLATLKHWPGHGSTSTDSHAALAVITESASTWRAVDRAAFTPALAQAGAIMVGHLALPALDPSGLPASLSQTLVNGQLLGDLGYRGLVVTDSLWMQPARAAGSPGQVALAALAAGDDMLLESPDVPAAFNAVLSAMRSNPTVRARVRAAVPRILAAKRLTPIAARC